MVVSTSAPGGAIGFGKAIQVSSGSGVPIISHNGFDQNIAGSDMLEVPADVVFTANATAPTRLPTLENIGSLDMDWGRWDNVDLKVESTRSGNLADGQTTNDVNWVVFKPASMAGLTGKYRYGNGSDIAIAGIDETGASLKGGVFEFDVNLAGGTDAISNGLLQINDSSNTSWRVTFNGDISGSYATMTDISGTFNGSTSVTGAIGGAFVSGSGTTPDFIGGFSLKAVTGGDFVQGMTVLNNETCFSCNVTSP
jgi:hypothetical protein